MWPFSDGEADKIEALFASDKLTELVWQDDVSQQFPGATTVDVVVSSPKPAFLAATYQIGLTYWPNGPVVRGVQNYPQGSTVTFYGVPVKPGAELALAASSIFGDSLPARVEVVRAGSGGAVEQNRADQNAKGGLPFGDLNTTLGLAAALLVLVLAVKWS